MPGCTLLVNGIPHPLPATPVFIYLDKNGRAVPPPNYVPALNDCYNGCGCGCGSGGSAGSSPASSSSCGGSCGGGKPAIGPSSLGFGGCSGDPGAKQLEAVNDLLQKASQL